MDSVPSASGLTMVSKKGMEPSSLLSSTVKLDGRVNTVYVLKEALFVDLLMNDKGVKHIPVPIPRGWVQYLELFVLGVNIKCLILC